MKHKLIFVSSPYSHKEHEIENIRYRQAMEYTAVLMNMGEFSYSPIATGLAIAKRHSLPTDWNYWGDFCEAMMERCDELHVLMLDGWEKSSDVKAEIELAKVLDKKIIYVDPKVVLVETLELKTHAQMMQSFSDYLDSDEFKKLNEIEKLQLEKDKRVSKYQLKKFKDKFDNNFSEIVEKIIKKYESDEYVNRWMTRGMMPSEDLYYFLYSYAKKFGRKATKKEYVKYGNEFTGGLYYIHGYFFNIMSGQGTVIKIIKWDGK